MIIYNPLDGLPVSTSVLSKPRHCFLITRLGSPIPRKAKKIINVIEALCRSEGYTVINAGEEITGRDFLLKIWKLIAASPVCVAICHEEFPIETQMNIYYELGIAQAMGKETVIIKSGNVKIPSDLIRTEYIEFNENFKDSFLKYLKSVEKQAEHYHIMAEQLENDPLLAIDYLKRSFLISGDTHLRIKANDLLNNSGLEERAKNSVERLAASF